MRYASDSSELTISTANSPTCPASSDPSPRNHLLQDPPVGGSPTIDSVPMKNAAKVTGILRPRPPS